MTTFVPEKETITIKTITTMTREEIYDECYDALSQAVANELISADDELEDNMYELLDFCESYDDDNYETWKEVMTEVWSDFDEW